MKRFLVLLIALLSIHVLMGSSEINYSNTSKHEKNIRKLIENEYPQKAYDMYPLYGTKDQIVGYLAEFEDTFAYCLIENSTSQNCNVNDEPYTIKKGREWSRYTKEITTFPEYEIVYEEDETGNKITHTESHFKAAGVTNEKRYMIKCWKVGSTLGSTMYVPAIKSGDKYLNLVSTTLEEFEIVPIFDGDDIPCI